MNTRPVTGPTLFRELLIEGRGILADAWTVARRGWLWLLLALLVVGAIAWTMVPHDRALLRLLHAGTFPHQKGVVRTAEFLSFWGDYLTYNVPFSLLLWLYGVWKRNLFWRRLGLICFLGGTLGGFTDDLFRFTLGRPRPDAHLPDGFYGIPAAWTSRFESFPSGHAAAVFGSATALFLTCRWMGVLTGIYALLVIWSRMELSKHFPSDILVGSTFGLVTGWLVGKGARLALSSRAMSDRSRS